MTTDALPRPMLTDKRIPRRAHDELVRRGFRVLTLPPLDTLPPPVNSHTDMLLFPSVFPGDSGRFLFVPAEYLKNCEADSKIKTFAAAGNYNIISCKTTPGRKYPTDVAYNAVKIGNYLLCRRDSVAEEISLAAEKCGIKILNVNQGYAKCSTCVVSDTAIVTADKTIAEAANYIGGDVLLITPGFVGLVGYGTGFIGGASGYDAKGENVYFCGNLSLHPDGDRISDFCLAHGKRAISLSDEPLYDVGSMFFV